VVATDERAVVLMLPSHNFSGTRFLALSASVVAGAPAPTNRSLPEGRPRCFHHDHDSDPRPAHPSLSTCILGILDRFGYFLSIAAIAAAI
jgi:hypothetical protein